MTVDQALLSTLEWRCIGPFRGGRAQAVVGHPTQPAVFYFGAAAGGVWKTDSGGAYWENISDGFFNTASVGAIAVSEADPNIIYVGTGDSCIRNDVTHGDGIYKSTDGGRTWVNVGLQDTHHIGKIRVHPDDPNLVYVAAVGHIFGPNVERGVYRSKDGGRNWEQVLFKSENAGAIDLSMDQSNPRILYAAIWQAQRYPWTISSGGPDSGIWKSVDGGDTWTELSNNPGLPEGIKGRIGITASPVKAGRVWAVIEAVEGGVFRSDNGGETWEKTSDNPILRIRAWYYMHIYADTQDPDTVYGLNIQIMKSVDGGRTWMQMPIPHGDQHDLWIDPHNNQRMIEANDGGACITFNGGNTWSTIFNQPTAQFYHVDTDNQFPYHVYGTQQDNSAISVPSRSNAGAILWTECYPVGSSESGHIAVKPDDPNIVYSGAVGSSPGGGAPLLRYDHSTRQQRLITVWPESFVRDGDDPPKTWKYRFSRTYPITISPHDSNTVYSAGNCVFRTKNDGTSWEVLSPDLTRNDITKQEVTGGPISFGGTASDVACTIFAFAESPHEKGVLWAGSDDGLVHISRDDGKGWENVTPPGLPEWATVCTIEPSPHDGAKAYVTATNNKLDDERPYLFKTDNYGQTWKKIVNGMPENDFGRVIREDPSFAALLYAGTQASGVYVSLDDGESWQSLQNEMPPAPIHDLKVKDDDLVAATFGRGFWILDDLTPLRELTEQVTQKPVHLFKPRATYRIPPERGFPQAATPGVVNYFRSGSVAFYDKEMPDGRRKHVWLDAGQNPPEGVIVNFYLKERPQGEVTLNFLDAKGQSIRTFSSQSTGADGKPLVPAEPGMNRFQWNMRYPGSITPQGMRVPAIAGPVASPGMYQVQLTVDAVTEKQAVEIRKDPRVKATQEDLDRQFEWQIKIRDKLSENSGAVIRVRKIQQQVEEWARRIESQGETALAAAAKDLLEKLRSVEIELTQTQSSSPSTGTAHSVTLDSKLASIPANLSVADWAPTEQSLEVFGMVSEKVTIQLGRLQEIIDKDLPELNNLIRESEIPAILPP